MYPAVTIDELHDGARGNDLASSLNLLLAHISATWLKTRGFQRHLSAPKLRNYRLLLDEQAAQILAMREALAERVRRIGLTTIRPVGNVHSLRRLADADDAGPGPGAMLGELHRDNLRLLDEMRDARTRCEAVADVATASLLEVFIDEGEWRAWFLAEACGAAR